MLLAKSIILVSTALQIQFFPCHTQHFQFVKIGDTVVILCNTGEEVEDGGLSFSWYKRRNGEVPVLIKTCSGDKATGTFFCRSGKKKVVLEIQSAQMDDTGVYLCAGRHRNFYFGSSVVVGDSYNPSTTVTLLHPTVQDPPSQFTQSSGQLACVVHGVSNLVQISWGISGDPQPEVPTFLVKNRTGVLTFASLLPLPVDVHDSGKNFTCEVRFNSSSTSVKKSITFNNRSSGKLEDSCPKYIVSLVVVGVLMLLMLLLGFFCHLLCPSRLGFQSRIAEPGSSAEPEEGLCYAQLDFPLRSEDKKKRRGALQGRDGKI
nr:uncharacterized protein LOC110081427 isoform X2 [Pogona vitticeps]